MKTMRRCSICGKQVIFLVSGVMVCFHCDLNMIHPSQQKEGEGHARSVG